MPVGGTPAFSLFLSSDLHWRHLGADLVTPASPNGEDNQLKRAIDRLKRLRRLLDMIRVMEGQPARWHCYDALMRLRDAIEMLADSAVEALGVTTWADLGCGEGTFTLALADVLAAGSTIHAMDRDASALRKIPSAHKGVRITTHRGDFTNLTWPFAHLDGILMANSLHYVDDQATFIRACEPRMTLQRRFLIVEYDADEASRWLPYPVSQTRLIALFAAAGYSSIRLLGSRPSVYRRASLYAALIASSKTQRQ